MMAGMSYHSIPLEDRADPWQDAPAYVRMAVTRKARAYRVLKLYQRRCWNETAAAYEYSVATAAVIRALDRWEHEENNPRLF